MNRRELVKAVAAHCEADARQVDEIVRGLTDVITAVVSKGEPVAISGFAKFAKVERPARMGRNPATGEQIKIKASKKARITALKGFKDAVMTPSQAPKLARGIWPPAETAAAKSTTTRATKATTAKASTTKAAAAKPATRSTSTRTAAAKTTSTRGTKAATTTTARKATPARAAATRKATTTRATTTRKTAKSSR